MARARKGGISKAQGYANRVFCIEYDLNGMIEAYGLDYVVELGKAIINGEVKTSADGQRWAADRALQMSNPIAIDYLELMDEAFDEVA